MRFAEPHWLMVGLVAVTLLLVLLVRSERLRSRAIAVLQGARIVGRTASPGRRWLRVGLSALAVAMAFVALARPQRGLRWETVDRKGTDLLLVVDTSKSMDADDVKPTRLERSKRAIRDLVDRFPGDRMGLVAFAGDAFVQSPMTLDHGALLESLDALDTSTIARGGTNIGRGIDVATDALATEPGHQKIMVLLTDGEDLEGEGLAEAKHAAEAGITIDTIGVGTTAGELVPARDANGATVGLTRDEAGNPVRSHLDEPGLQAIAAAAHGTYRPLGADGRGLDRLYDEALAGLSQAQASSRTRRVYAEWFAVPLSLSLFFLVVEAMLGRRWRGLPAVTRKSQAAVRAMAAGAAALLLLAIPTSAHASATAAAKAYAAGHFDEAAKDFEAESAHNPKDARLAFNAGDAGYRAGHYEAAAAAFKRALGSADPHLQQRVLYNQGDVLYRLGEAKKPEERAETIAQWKGAVEAYDGAIALDAHDADARFNRDFVKGRLAALEQKDKESPPKNDSSKGGDSQKDSPKNGDAKSGDAKNGDAKNGDAKNGDAKNGDAKNGGKDAPGSTKGADPGGANPPKADTGKPPAPGTTNGSGAPPASPSGPETAGTPDGKEGAQPGRLSARDARALLGALRGDERHGVYGGSDAGASTDDSPRKDW